MVGNSYETAIGFGIENLPANAAVNLLSGVTREAADPQVVASFLREKGLWMLVSPIECGGAIEGIRNKYKKDVAEGKSPSLTQEEVELLNTLWSAVFGGGSLAIRANELPASQLVKKVLNTLQREAETRNIVTSSVVNEFYSLFGGLLHQGLTEAKFIEDYNDYVSRVSTKLDKENLDRRVSNFSALLLERHVGLSVVTQASLLKCWLDSQEN